MAEIIEFTKNGLLERAKITSNGPFVIQVNRESSGFFIIYGNLEGMNKVVLYKSPFAKDILVKIDVPEFIEINITSESHVLEAKMENIS